MKNSIFALGFISIIAFVIYFLKSNNEIVTQPIPTEVIESTSQTTNTAIKEVIEQPTIKPATTPKFNNTPSKNVPENSSNDRYLFPNVDFTGITNFKLISSLDDYLYLDATILPVYEPIKYKMKTVKIGTSDQGDVFYNGGLDYLTAVIEDTDRNEKDLLGIKAFAKSEISTNVATPFPRNPVFNSIELIVDNKIVENVQLGANQFVQCNDSNNRTFNAFRDVSVIQIDSCPNGIIQSDLIKIEDKNLYHCISTEKAEDTNWFVNRLDVILVSCDFKNIQDAAVLTQFPNLKKLLIWDTPPSFEVLNQLINLESLTFINSKSDKKEFDLSKISNLTKLEYISFNKFNLIKASSLINQENLQSLLLTNSTVDDYSFTSALMNIKYFDITNNQIDIFPNIGFGSTLEVLKANKNNLKDITGFETFTNLKSLYLRNNNISSIENLNLDNNQYELVDVFANPVSCDQNKMRDYRFIKVKCK